MQCCFPGDMHGPCGIAEAQEITTIFSKSDDDNWNDVCQELKRFVAHWKKIGRALGLLAYQLEEIEGNNRTNSECLDKMLEIWIGQNYSVEKFGLPSWRTLCKALSQVADMKYFKELAEKHKGKIELATLIYNTCPILL